MDHSLSSTHSTTTSTAHSSRRLADIAARVITELNLNHHDPFHDDFYYQNDDDFDDDVVDDDTDDSEFEFAILTGADNTSPISADEIFSDGQIKPVLKYPLFDTTLVHQNDAATATPKPQPPVRVPLRRLLMSDKNSDGVASTSSSEGDELEGVPDGTYCVWVPKKNKDKNDGASMKKKSKSTGTGDSNNASKRWRIRDLLLNRSHSDGKDTLAFLTSHHGDLKKRREKGNTNTNINTKKSYLPYRQDLVGFFSVRPLREIQKTI